MYRGFVGTFFSHCLSLLSSLWAITSVGNVSLYHNGLSWIRVALLLIIANSCLALLRYGSSSFGYKLRKLHIFTLNLSTIISFTIIESVQHNIYKSPDSLKYIPLSNIISFVSNLMEKDYRTKLKLSDSLIAINSLILCLISFLNENYFSIALYSSYLFGYFVVGDCGFLFDTELPSVDAYQYLTCFLNIFMVYSFDNY